MLKFNKNAKNYNNNLLNSYINIKREYWWLTLQVFISVLLAGLSVIFIELWIIWLHSTCYTLPLNKADIKEGRVSLIILLVLLMLFWSPLIVRKRYTKYIVLTTILISPTVYYVITAMPYDKTWHSGLCW